MKNQINTNTNMNVIAQFVIAASLLLSCAVAKANNFVEGTHYSELSTTINKRPNSQKEVREFFSFYCPGCYRHEPVISALKAKLPADVPLIKNHIDGMPGRDLVIEQGLSKALITAKILKIEDKITAAIFSYIHVNRSTFSNNEDIKRLFLLNGVDAKRFDKIFNSFSVKTGINKMNKSTKALRNQGVTRVPTIIVNGRYMVETGAIKSKEQYIALVLYLLNR